MTYPVAYAVAYKGMFCMYDLYLVTRAKNHKKITRPEVSELRLIHFSVFYGKAQALMRALASGLRPLTMHVSSLIQPTESRQINLLA